MRGKELGSMYPVFQLAKEGRKKKRKEERIKKVKKREVSEQL